MAKRKQRFKFHGKCAACAGPIMDWREVWVDYSDKNKRARHYVLDMDSDGPLTTRYCETCRPHMDAVDRLDFPQDRKFRYMTSTGRWSTNQPNIAQLPRAYPKRKRQRYASK